MNISTIFNQFKLPKQTGLTVHLRLGDAHIGDTYIGDADKTVNIVNTSKKNSAPFEQTGNNQTSTDDYNWQSALDALNIKLALIDAKPNTPLRVVLSSDFVRYLLLPAQAVNLSHAEKNAYAKAALRQLHGLKVDNWLIKFDDSAPNQATLLAAIDQQLHSSLVQIAAEHNLILLSVKPYLTQVFNGLHRSLKLFTGYLAIIEGTKILLLNIKNAHIDLLKSQLINDDWQIELNQLLDREQTLGHVNSNEIIICAPQHQLKLAFAKKGWQINLIDQKNQAFEFLPNKAINNFRVSA